MKRALVLSLICVIGLGFAAVADTTWQLEVNSTGPGELHLFQTMQSQFAGVQEGINSVFDGSLQLNQQAIVGSGLSEWKTLSVEGGETYFQQCAVVGGTNYQKNPAPSGDWHMETPNLVATAFVGRNVHNVGDLNIGESVNHATAWQMSENMSVSGSGDTTIGTNAVFWTNTKAAGPDDRTDVSFNIGFEDGTNSFHNVGLASDANTPAQRSFGWAFGKCLDSSALIAAGWSNIGTFVNTDSSFDYGEFIIINP